MEDENTFPKTKRLKSYKNAQIHVNTQTQQSYSFAQLEFW